MNLDRLLPAVNDATRNLVARSQFQSENWNSTKVLNCWKQQTTVTEQQKIITFRDEDEDVHIS